MVVPGDIRPALQTEAIVVEKAPGKKAPVDIATQPLRPVSAPDIASQNNANVIRSRLANDTGGLNLTTWTNTIEGSVHRLMPTAKDISRPVRLLSDRLTRLEETSDGQNYLQMLNQAQIQANTLSQRYTFWVGEAHRKMTPADFEWVQEIRPDGSTNYGTLVEHPERIGDRVVPENVRALAETERVIKEETGDIAIRVNIPMIAPDGTSIPYSKAQGGRLFRVLTPEMQQGFKFGGEFLEALIKWGKAHPEKNPEVNWDSFEKRTKSLTGPTASGKVPKTGALEMVRSIPELPEYLSIKGKMQPVIEPDILKRSHISIAKQTRKLALWEHAQKNLLKRFGKFDPKTNRFRVDPKETLGIEDVDSLIDNMRATVAKSSSNPDAMNKTFDIALDSYNQIRQGGLLEEVFNLGTEPKTAGTKILTAANNNVNAILLMLQPIYDIVQMSGAVQAVGFKNVTKAALDVLRHPIESPAEYKAAGAIIDGHTDWSVSSAYDLVGKVIPQIVSAPGLYSEKMSQSIVARAADKFADTIDSRNVTPTDRNTLKSFFRLSEAEINQIAKEGMTPDIRSRMRREFVAAITPLGELPLRRGVIRQNRLARLFVPFTSFLEQNAKLWGRTARFTLGELKSDQPDMEKLGSIATSLLAFVGGAAGRGFVQNSIRRTIMGKDILDPEVDGFEELFARSLLDAGFFSWAGQLYEAAEYAHGDPYRFTSNLAPRLSIVTEMASMIAGLGPYSETPFGKRVGKATLRFNPAVRVIDNWIRKSMFPSTKDYDNTRSFVRKYQKRFDKQPAWGMFARNSIYDDVFDKLVKGDHRNLSDSIREYGLAAAEQGKTDTVAKRNLRMALMARRPIPLADDEMGDFWSVLTPDQRTLAAKTNQRYMEWVNSILPTGE